MTSRTISLDRYVARRLGSGWRAPLRMFSRAFTSTTLAGFWRYWNPVYGYALGRWCYAPLLRAGLPRPLAVLITFSANGLFLHDVAIDIVRGKVGVPWATGFFTLIGLLVVSLGNRPLRLPAAGRVAVHVGVLVLSATATHVVSSILQ